MDEGGLTKARNAMDSKYPQLSDQDEVETGEDESCSITIGIPAMHDNESSQRLIPDEDF